jgi:hypothetical protein
MSEILLSDSIESEDSEESRYGRDKSLSVDHNYINSGTYRRKFDNLSDNEELNRTLYQCAKKILAHRSGSDFEDMYWLDGESGKVFAAKVDMKLASRVVYPIDYMNRYRNIPNKITIHNHPRNMPPSIGDFESAYRNKYAKGIIVCHNGTIYTYNNIGIPDRDIYGTLAADFRSLGYSDYTSNLMALSEMRNLGILEFSEVE